MKGCKSRTKVSQKKEEFCLWTAALVHCWGVPVFLSWWPGLSHKPLTCPETLPNLDKSVPCNIICILLVESWKGTGVYSGFFCVWDFELCLRQWLGFSRECQGYRTVGRHGHSYTSQLQYCLSPSLAIPHTSASFIHTFIAIHCLSLG